MREAVISNIQQERVIAILRGIECEKCNQIVDALQAGGIKLLELTFDQTSAAAIRNTAQAVLSISRQYAGTLCVGAGTVLTLDQVELAAGSGAQFIISPNLNPEIIRRTRELDMVSIPGAMTPTEILAAHHAGADFVKVFPVAALGSSYIRAVCAPINQVRLLAVGGIDAGNVRAFLEAGAVGAGVGGNLVNPEWIREGQYDKISAAASELVAAVNSVN